jgi:hypothetical protein
MEKSEEKAIFDKATEKFDLYVPARRKSPLTRSVIKTAADVSLVCRSIISPYSFIYLFSVS